MPVDRVCTFAEADASEDIAPNRKEALNILIRAALDFLGRDWHGIQAVHIQVLYTERNSNRLDFVAGTCGSPLMVSHPDALFASLSDALKSESKDAHVDGFDECRLLPYPPKVVT